jgi:type II secretion system protein G
MKNKNYSAFTLIELLVVISIIGVLVALTLIGMQGARESARDATRKSDLEMIRSGLEIYRADCNIYPTDLGTVLTGDDTLGLTSCSNENIYISKVPSDPITTERNYSYTRLTTSTYIICAALEQDPTPAIDVTGCGSCTADCNYKITNP